MPQMTALAVAGLMTGANGIADAKRKKVVKMALTLEGDAQVNWQGGGNLNNFIDNSKSDRTPKTGKFIQMVCWLWPIYLAWRTKVATETHLKAYRMTQDAAMFTAGVLHHPVATPKTDTDRAQPAFTFGSRDESAMGAAAFYRAGASSLGLGLPGDIVMYYRAGYEQPCHIAVQVSNAHVSSLWTVPRDANGIDYNMPQAVANVDLEAAISTGANGAIVTTRHSAPPWA